jgi:DNA-binding response OmpR family regulator
MIATPLGRDEGLRVLDDASSPIEEQPAPLTFVIGYGRGAPALASGLERSGLAVRTFDQPAMARREILRTQPDLILVGDEQKDGSALQFIRELQREGVDGLMFFLAPSADPRVVGQALEAGADDVCGPPHSVGAIVVRRLVNLRRRDVPMRRPRDKQSRPLTLGGVTVDPFTREVSDGRVPFTLSGRELELLVRLMEAAGDVVSRQKLLKEIWGDEQEDDAVLDATVHRLRKRLEERLARPGFVATVRGVGYRLKKE